MSMAGALSHAMVPLHEFISDEEALRDLEPWAIFSPLQFTYLPAIASDDPAVVDAAEQQNISDAIGRVVRITRRSVSAGFTYAWRVVSSAQVFHDRPALSAPDGFVGDQESEGFDDAFALALAGEARALRGFEEDYLQVLNAEDPAEAFKSLLAEIEDELEDEDQDDEDLEEDA
jgi:DNA-directed RNA polymerase subunit H (RpoH/RPB5)